MPSIVSDPLTNHAYGFPRGAVRRITPKVLAVVHITANMGDAQAQRDYANRAGSNGPSAHYYIDRDGGGIHAVDEKRFAAWSNGDLKSPKLTNAGVKYLDGLRPTHNANEGCYLEIECVGTATTAGQWTDAQFATVARLIARAADDTGLPISATTVLPHAFINTIDRAHCPSLNVGAHMSRLIAAAKGMLDVVPAPITDEHEMMITTADNSTWYELDGVTVHSKGHAALGPRRSPYGVGTKRAIFANDPDAAHRGVVLVIPKTSVVPPPPPPAPSPDTAKLAAAKAKAAEIVAL